LRVVARIAASAWLLTAGSITCRWTLSAVSWVHPKSACSVGRSCV